MFGRVALVMGRWFGAGFEDLDDDHPATASRAGRLGRLLVIDGLASTDIGSRIMVLRRQQPTGQGDIVGAMAVGEQTVMPDMVEPFWEDVDQEAPHELMDRQVHGFIAINAFGSIILPGKGDDLVVDADQTTVRDGDPMGIAGEVSEHRLRPGERFLGINRKVGLVERLEIGVEGRLVSKVLVVVEELKASVGMGLFETSEDQASEQTREDTHRQEEVGSAGDPF